MYSENFNGEDEDYFIPSIDENLVITSNNRIIPESFSMFSICIGVFLILIGLLIGYFINFSGEIHVSFNEKKELFFLINGFSYIPLIMGILNCYSGFNHSSYKTIEWDKIEFTPENIKIIPKGNTSEIILTPEKIRRVKINAKKTFSPYRFIPDGSNSRTIFLYSITLRWIEKYGKRFRLQAIGIEDIFPGIELYKNIKERFKEVYHNKPIDKEYTLIFLILLMISSFILMFTMGFLASQ